MTVTHRVDFTRRCQSSWHLVRRSLLRLALEAAYATAARAVGNGANLLLRRVLNLECYRPVNVGQIVEIRGVALHFTRAYLVVGLIGAPDEGQTSPWMDGLLGFVQVDAEGRLCEFPRELTLPKLTSEMVIVTRTHDQVIKVACAERQKS